jgi:sRNA-binding regulator protein Hfq
MKKAKLLTFLIVLFVFSSYLNAQTVKNVIIFPFFTKGKDIPEASIGVLSSVMNYLKFLPTAKFTKSDFDVKGRDIKEVIKLFQAYDEFIVVTYKKDKETFIYEINIYDRSGELKNSFTASSGDLFDIIDIIVSSLSSYYGGGAKGFGVLNFKSQLPETKTFTLILNDEVLAQVKGTTNLSQRIISKTPYTIMLRNDETKEVIFKKEITLLDNESADIELKEPERKSEVITNQINVPQESPKYTKFQAYQDIKKGIANYSILENNAFRILKEEALVLDKETRINIYKEHELSTGLTILATGLNIVPGLGSIIIGDSGGFLMTILTPYISFLLFAATVPNNNRPGNSTLALISGTLTVAGYIYNLARPFIYQAEWNGRLKELLLFDTKVSLEENKINVSMNIRF